MKKALSIIGTTIAIIGVFVAVSLKDGSNHEIAIRLGGLGAFVVGALIASASKAENNNSITIP